MLALPYILALSLTATAHANPGTTRYFEISNASGERVTAIAAAPAGSDAFEPIAFAAPLRGGLHSTMLALPGAGCRHDLRIGLHDGRSLLYPAIDICRHRGLKVTARDGRRTGSVVAAAPADPATGTREKP